jgi:hypothetical protein
MKQSMNLWQNQMKIFRYDGPKSVYATYSYLKNVNRINILHSINIMTK